MNVLVAVASKHGATREIADVLGRAIGEALDEAGTPAEVEVLFAETAVDPAEYDAVVLGSAVYIGHWLETAARFVDRHAAVLRAMPVWLFSSGPVGEPLRPAEATEFTARLLADTGAVEHRVFGGKIDRGVLRFAERALVKALRVKDGDYRDWHAISAWGREIGLALAKTSSQA
ncbi:flavodoxin domain-containing protein [Amycolatopsis sp. CA-230715]|uniref:flavodoxin domain-containing protein n=1 Tax=Amycolatopsis sp. CA-230715 TaxID=2745196 RepID=UPI001C035A9E|nr:flavodoxin domain-containing protein [Amycolatopsis sp. CA-230715]QWF77997.1 Protoporphyrinogen IX dehydrogenase [menaquinone] [Amycolatopsis sp. CA-230715]